MGGVGFLTDRFVTGGYDCRPEGKQILSFLTKGTGVTRGQAQKVIRSGRSVPATNRGERMAASVGKTLIKSRLEHLIAVRHGDKGRSPAGLYAQLDS